MCTILSNISQLMLCYSCPQECESPLCPACPLCLLPPFPHSMAFHVLKPTVMISQLVFKQPALHEIMASAGISGDGGISGTPKRSHKPVSFEDKDLSESGAGLCRKEYSICKFKIIGRQTETTTLQQTTDINRHSPETITTSDLQPVGSEASLGVKVSGVRSANVKAPECGTVASGTLGHTLSFLPKYWNQLYYNLLFLLQKVSYILWENV